MFLLRKNIKDESYYLNLITFITASFWLIAKLISWRVWTSYRLFPLIPPFDFLNELPSWYHLFFFAVSLISLVFLIIKPSSKIAGLLIISELFSLIADQNRWQPWEYQYLFIMLLLSFNKKPQHYFSLGVKVIIISIYFYSGVSKLNPGFLRSVWSGMLLRGFFEIININANTPIIYYAGYAIGLIEIICAAGLFFKRTKKITALILIAVHCFNLLVLGPFGINYNVIVWPWNVAMIAYLYILFIHSPAITYNLDDFKKGWNKLVIVCWFILPMFNLFGWWDNYLSSVLYSGKLKEMVICVKKGDDTFTKSLEPYYSDDHRNICNGDKMILVTKWAMKEMKVPVYPERRVYLKIKEVFIQKYNLPETTCFLFYMNQKEELK